MRSKIRIVGFYVQAAGRGVAVCHTLAFVDLDLRVAHVTKFCKTGLGLEEMMS